MRATLTAASKPFYLVSPDKTAGSTTISSILFQFVNLHPLNASDLVQSTPYAACCVSSHSESRQDYHPALFSRRILSLMLPPITVVLRIYDPAPPRSSPWRTSLRP